MEPVALIVASDREHLKNCLSQFTACGFQVQTASTALECLKSLLQRAPVMLGLDLDLARGGADGVLACLRESPDLPLIRFVVATGSSCPEDLSRSSLLPLPRCFQKPVVPETIVDALLATTAPAPYQEPLDYSDAS